MTDYIVIGIDPNDHWSTGPFTVHVAKGETVKDTQDRIAEYAQSNPRVIYSVVLTKDYRTYYATWLTRT